MVNKDNSMKRTNRRTWSFMSFVSITFLSVSFCVHMVGGVMEYPCLLRERSTESLPPHPRILVVDNRRESCMKAAVLLPMPNLVHLLHLDGIPEVKCHL